METQVQPETVSHKEQEAANILLQYFTHVATVFGLPPIALMEHLDALVKEKFGNG